MNARKRSHLGRSRIAVRSRCAIGVLAALASWTSDLSAIAQSSRNGAAPPRWKMVWNDEFDVPRLDRTKWEPVAWNTPYNEEQQAYSPSQVAVVDGMLTLTAEAVPLEGKPYRSGKVESKYEQQYGRWEIRAQLPATRGVWPAIWLLPEPSRFPWPTQGEIDILENRGTQPHLTSSAYHYGPDVARRNFVVDEQRTGRFGALANYHDEFHVYALEWEKRQLRFFVDDVHFFTVYDEDVDGFIGRQSAPMEVNLNVAVGGEFLRDAQPDATSVWPQQMLVDYVRVYKNGAATTSKVLDNGSFERQGGSLAGWSLFGDTTTNALNVVVTDEAASEGRAALKLSGQFNGAENFTGVEQALSVAPGDALTATASALVCKDDAMDGTDNQLIMRIDYYSVPGAKFHSDQYVASKSVVLADASSKSDEWMRTTLDVSVPDGAVEARLAMVFVQLRDEAGAVIVDDVQVVYRRRLAEGDADGDGDVDGSDFLSLQRSLGTSQGVPLAQGDVNGDGVVDDRDLAEWEARFGEQKDKEE